MRRFLHRVFRKHHLVIMMDGRHWCLTCKDHVPYRQRSK